MATRRKLSKVACRVLSAIYDRPDVEIVSGWYVNGIVARRKTDKVRRPWDCYLGKVGRSQTMDLLIDAGAVMQTNKDPWFCTYELNPDFEFMQSELTLIACLQSDLLQVGAGYNPRAVVG